MTDTPDPTPTGQPRGPESPVLAAFWMWLCQPTDGNPEHLLMVQVQGTGDSTYFRPLMGMTEDAARGLRPVAMSAARELGVPVVLRRYDLEAVSGLRADRPRRSTPFPLDRCDP